MLSHSFSWKVKKSYLSGAAIFLLSFLSTPLAIGGTFIPNFFVLGAILVILLKYHPSLESKDYRFLFHVLIFFLLSIHLTYYSGLYLEKYKGLTQLMLSLIISILALNLGANRNLVSEKSLRNAIIILLFFCFVEIFVPPFRALVTFVRGQLFPSGILYSNELRDILLSGHLRPTLFSSEPSHVTKMFFALMFSYGVLIREYFWIKILFLFLIGLYVFASPTIILSFGLIVFHRYYENIFNLKKLGFVKLLLLGALFFVLSAFLIQYVFTGLDARLTKAINGTDGSFSKRIIFPYVSAYDALSRYPILGIGLSAKEFIEKLSSLKYLDLTYMAILGNNAFAHTLIYFGASSIVFYRLLIRFISTKIHRAPFYVFILIFVYSNNMGGFETPRYWVFLSLMFLSVSLSNKNRLDVKKKYTNNWNS